jgi:uncharacterized protein
MIPTTNQCYEMMEKYGMLENIKAHSIMVEKAAAVIAGEVKKNGVNISLSKVAAGALMHDIGKTLCLNTREDHAAKGSEICATNNFEEISDIVREHVILKKFDADGEITEKEIIYYADKRVEHDKIVSLEERMEDLFIRYANGNHRMEDLIEENFTLCREVEKKLFAKMSFIPDSLEEAIKYIPKSR